MYPADTPLKEPTATPDQLPCFDARDLVGRSGQAHIALDDKIYTLRLTRAGKLILTK